MLATWAVFFCTILLVSGISHGAYESPPRWLRPTCLIAVAILFAASLVVIWSGVKP